MNFTDDFEVQVFLILLFPAICLSILIGNLGLAVLVTGDPQLHNPIYHFLSVLSFLVACYSSVFIPKMLINFLPENKGISFLGCEVQMLLFVTFGITECFLLAATTYDPCVAIYNPLLYSVNISPRVYMPLIFVTFCIIHYTREPHLVYLSVHPIKLDMSFVMSLLSLLFLALIITQTSFYSSTWWVLLG